MTPERQAKVFEYLPNICVCGSGTTWPLLHAFLDRVHLLRTDDDSIREQNSMYKSWGPVTPDWVELVAHLLDALELVEHGTGIGWPWLTERGEIVREFLEEYGDDFDKWPRWATEDAS